MTIMSMAICANHGFLPSNDAPDRSVPAGQGERCPLPLFWMSVSFMGQRLNIAGLRSHAQDRENGQMRVSSNLFLDLKRSNTVLIRHLDTSLPAFP